MYPLLLAGIFVFCTVRVRRCMDYYPTIFDKDFILWLFAAPTKNESPKFRSIQCLVLPTTNRKGFLNLGVNCKQVYCLLPHHYWQGCFTLDCCSVTTNEVKMLPSKRSLTSLGVSSLQPSKILFGKRLLPLWV